MDKSLIFDLGFYDGDTSLPYLRNGFNVVGVDCNPNLEISTEVLDFEKNNQLIFEKRCISDKDGDVINFYIQPNTMVFSSVNKAIAERLDKSICCQVETITLGTLMKKYGVPIYCKIDIEGNDIVALKSLANVEEKPKYISCETECIDHDDYLAIDGLENINTLHELGYNKFFLVNQATFEPFYFDVNGEYEWKTYEEIVDELKHARASHWFYTPYSFWWDVYATF